jgi:hypothetical protein
MGNPLEVCFQLGEQLRNSQMLQNSSVISFNPREPI